MYFVFFVGVTFPCVTKGCLSYSSSSKLPSRELTYPVIKALLKMIFLFPRWDMLIPWRVSHFAEVFQKCSCCGQMIPLGEMLANGNRCGRQKMKLRYLDFPKMTGFWGNLIFRCFFPTIVGRSWRLGVQRSCWTRFSMFRSRWNMGEMLPWRKLWIFKTNFKK